MRAEVLPPSSRARTCAGVTPMEIQACGTPSSADASAKRPAITVALLACANVVPVGRLTPNTKTTTVLEDADGVSDGVVEAVRDGEGEGELLSEALLEVEGVCEALELGDDVALPLVCGDSVALIDGESEAADERLGEALSVTVRGTLSVALAVNVVLGEDE